MIELAPWRWALGAFCAFSIGIAKTGMPGFGILAVPLMVLVVGDARLSAGWLLPVLCFADVFAILYWRRHASAGRLFALAPWVLIGVAVGSVTLGLSERYLRPMVGVIILLMLLTFLRRRYQKPDEIQAHPVPYGVSAGFATTVANAAGPVMNLYLLSKRLPKEEFLATGAWFFFFINLTKVPVYWYHGLFSARSLAFDAIVAPAVLAGAVTGRWLVRHLPPVVFEWMVISLTGISAILLFR